MNYDPSLEDPERISRPKLLLELTEYCKELVSALKIQREPDIERSILFMNPEHFNGVDMPEFIRRNIASSHLLQEVVIDATVNHLTSQAELQIHFTLEGENTLRVVIDAGSDMALKPSSRMYSDDDQESLPCPEPATRTELNRFLASLFTRNKTGDYSAFDDMDLSNADIVERLVEALEEASISHAVESEYFLTTTLGLTADGIRYLEGDGELKNAVVTVEHHGKATAIDIVFDKTIEATDAPTNEDDYEHLMQELEGIQTYTKDVNGESSSVASSNELLIMVRNFLDLKRRQVFALPVESMGDMDIVDPTLAINLEDSRND